MNNLTDNSLSHVVQNLPFDYIKFDYIIFSDGSGTVNEKACGYCAVVLNVVTWDSYVYYAGKSNGTNNVAELAPIVDALAQIEKINKKFKINVAIVSDSEMTVKAGNKEYSRTANAYLWSSIQYFENLFWNLKFFHIKRNTNEANAFCDEIAGQVRKEFEEMKNGPI